MISHEEIRQAVRVYVPEALDTYDMLTAKPLPASKTSGPLEWTDEMRLTVMLHMWRGYDAARPN